MKSFFLLFLQNNDDEEFTFLFKTENLPPPLSHPNSTMAAIPPNAAQLLRAAFSRRGFSLPDDSGAAAVSAKLVALMSASPENDNVACKGSNNSAADGLARQFEAYAMAT